MNKVKDQCPHCGKRGCIECYVYNNVENYGSHGFNVKCKHCKKMIKVYLDRVVELVTIEKSDSKESDF
jgi:transcription elongation factor Elf1